MVKIKRILFLSLATGLTIVFSLNSQGETPYMLPPDEILSIADVEDARATRLTGAIVNDILGNPYTWLADNRTIIFTAVPAGRGDAPVRPAVPRGLKLELRYSGITWGNDDVAVVNEYWRNDRRLITSFFNLRKQDEKSVIWDRSVEDRYGDPGSFQTVNNEYGLSGLQFGRRGRSLYLFGMGASPDGDHPFLDEFNIRDRYVKNK